MALCNKCNSSPPFGGDSWCLACSAVEQITTELRGQWGQAGTRAIASDLVATCLRQVRAVRRLGLALGAGLSKPPEPPEPPKWVTTKQAEERDRSSAPGVEKEGVSRFVKREDEDEEDDENSSEGSGEEDDEEEEERTTTAKAKAVRPAEEPRHREGGATSHREERPRERNRSPGPRSELPRLRSRTRREARTGAGEKREPRRRHRPNHRGGSKHQKFHKAAEDPYRRFHQRRDGSFWDQDHFER